MFFLRPLLALTVLAGALSNPLHARQATNTNPQISKIVDALDMQIHVNIPAIDTMQANGSATDRTVGSQVDQLVRAFNSTASGLKKTAVSSGSNTTSPTNDDISIVFSDVMQLLSTGLSGMSNVVPSFASMVSELDPAVASAANVLNTTLPGSLKLVHIMMVDAQQFFVKEGGWTQTLAALGF